ncbi:hypothetical protein, partial [Anaerobiospirillum succiniciproducens]|uniref:hypothetical protein n=1 Tax=Anaerobiospirillum succiniciproducens TaxID=13335 RepID=UPI002357C79A
LMCTPPLSFLKKNNHSALHQKALKPKQPSPRPSSNQINSTSKSKRKGNGYGNGNGYATPSKSFHDKQSD